MLRDLVKRYAQRALQSQIGKTLIEEAVLQSPAEARFSRVQRWPSELKGFEDLAFLFSSSYLNHGIALLRIDEAAFIYRIARDAGPGTLAEIGRFKGGSTVITAAAMHPEAHLWSYDAHVWPPEVQVALGEDATGAQIDRELLDALRRFGIDTRVHLVVGDSRNVDLPPGPLTSLFLDGDHTYEGVRADYLRWSELVGPGGTLLFHDAVDTGGLGSHYPGVVRLVEEIGKNGDFERQPDVGSIAWFRRR